MHAPVLGGFGAPVARRLPAALDRKSVGDLGLEIDKPNTEAILTQVDEGLDGSERERARRVDDGITGAIPAPACNTGAFSAKCSSCVSSLDDAICDQQGSGVDAVLDAQQ